MAFIESGFEANLSGTTPLEVAPAPGTGVRRLVRSVHVCNVDSASATIIIGKKKASTTYELARKTLAAGADWTFDKLTVLDATDESITVRTSAAVTTTNPTVDVAFADVS